jgi:A/G-specific adenine glycosylase
MMLQQTQVATVLPYYQRWMRRFPTLESLAAAPQADVLSLWQGLGYYARARALHAGAQHVLRTRDGQLPTSATELQALPGIGPYTAGAIASIAFEQPAPIVDGNVIRVLTRVFGLTGSPLHQPLKSFLWQLAEALIPPSEARDFNQALMEFGATCCTPKNPTCYECPLRGQCYAFTHHAVEQLPELPERPKVTRVVNVAALVRRGDRILVGQLPHDAPRWASMWQLPNVNLNPNETDTDGLQRALNAWCGTAGQVGMRLQSVQHSVTRYRITVHLYEVTLLRDPGSGSCQAIAWQDHQQLATLAMPAAHRKLVSRVFSSE